MKKLTTLLLLVACLLVTVRAAHAMPLTIGATGSQVAQLQQKLQSAGLYSGPITSTLDFSTDEAVKQLQASENLNVDGIVGPQTLSAVSSLAAAPVPAQAGSSQAASLASPLLSLSSTLRVGSADSAVSALQQLLISGGYLNTSAPSGTYDQSTSSAVAKFQSAHGLTADGILGPKTRALALSLLGVLHPGASVATTQVLCPNGNTVSSNCTLPPSTSSTSATATVTVCPNGDTLASNCTVPPAQGSVIVTATGTVCPNGDTIASNCTVVQGSTSATATVALCPNGDTVASNCTVAPAAGSVIVTAIGTVCPNGDTIASNCTVPAGTTSATATVSLCPNGDTVASNCTVPPAQGSVIVTSIGTLCPDGNTIASNCTVPPSTTSACAVGNTNPSISITAPVTGATYSGLIPVTWGSCNLSGNVDVTVAAGGHYVDDATVPASSGGTSFPVATIAHLLSQVFGNSTIPRNFLDVVVQSSASSNVSATSGGFNIQ